MLDLITIGTVGVDLFFKGDSLTHSKDRFELAVGGKYFADYFHQGLGGGAANVAIGVSRAGLKCGLMAKIGNNPFKKLINETLKEEKIEYEHLCQVEDEYYNVSAVLLSDEGEKTIVNYRSPHQHLMICEDNFEQLTSAKFIYLANLPNVSLTERMGMIRYAKNHGVMTIVNLGVVDCRKPKHQLEEFMKKVDCLIVNGHEFADLVKAPYKDIDFSEDVIGHYIPELSDNIVVITDGEKGSWGYMNGEVLVQKALPIHKIVDATGAGDGYTAGFIAEYITSRDVKKALESGAKYAMKILGKVGAN